MTKGLKIFMINPGKNDKNRKDRLNGKLKRAECKTSVKSAEETGVRYINAATHAELSLRRKCLSLPEIVRMTLMQLF